MCAMRVFVSVSVQGVSCVSVCMGSRVYGCCGECVFVRVGVLRDKNRDLMLTKRSKVCFLLISLKTLMLITFDMSIFIFTKIVQHYCHGMHVFPRFLSLTPPSTAKVPSHNGLVGPFVGHLWSFLALFGPADLHSKK